MTDSKQSAWFKGVVRVSAISLAVLLPATALAWFCGTGRMTGGGKLVSVISDVGGVDVTSPTTNGYELHCDNSLRGTWSNGNTSIAACAEWIFIDGQGSPQNNSSYIRITDLPPLGTTDICDGGTSVNTCPGNTLLLVPAQTPLKGQNQAHK